MPVTDYDQEFLEACVEVLDTHASVVAVTTRASGNIVPIEDLSKTTADGKPAAGYTFVSATRGRGALGVWRRIILNFTAEAATRRAVGELLQIIATELNAVALLANTTHPVDAFVVRGPGTEERFGFEVPEENPDAVRSGIQMTFEVAF